jgi:hypothetical protein
LLAMFLVVFLLVTLVRVSRRLLAQAKAEAAKAEVAQAEAAQAEAAQAEAATAQSATAATTIAERDQAGKAEKPPAKVGSRFSWVPSALGVIGVVIFSIFFYGGLVVFALHRVFGYRVPTVWVVLGDVSAALLVVVMLGSLGQAVKAIGDRLSRLRGRRWRDAIVTVSGYSAHPVASNDDRSRNIRARCRDGFFAVGGQARQVTGAQRACHCFHRAGLPNHELARRRREGQLDESKCPDGPPTGGT